MRVVWHGLPCCGVDILPDAPAPVSYAAGELVRFVQQKTGCLLPWGRRDGAAIVLRLAGDGSEFRQLLRGARSPEAYAIEADDSNLYLVGIDPAGLVYAVFDFLSTEVGIGFAGLGPLGTRIEFQSTLDVAVKRRCCVPELPYRGLQGAILEDAVEAAGGISPLHLQRLDWMAQHRMNTYVLDPGQAGDFDNIRRLLPEVKRRGLKVQWAHHGWYRWVPHAQYFEQHPEYFMLVDGRRRGSDYHPQLCLCTSNPEVVRVMAEEILAVLQEQPEVDVISLWPNDGEGMCECDTCRQMDRLPDGHVYDTRPGTEIRYTRSRRHPNKTLRYAHFVNEVARKVGEVRPDVDLSALFYYDIDAPPEGIALEPNVQPVLAHYWRCWRHSLDHPQCENVYFERITTEWAERYPGRVVIYDYLMGMSVYVSLPWPIVPMMHRDWQRYRQMGIAGATIQSQACHFTVYGPTYSAFARMGWNMDAPTRDLSVPYYEDLYAEAAAPVLEMVKLLEQRFFGEECEREHLEDLDRTYKADFPHCLYPTPDGVTRWLDEDLLEALDRCLYEARASAMQDRTRANVAKLQAAVDYWKLAYAFHQALSTVRRRTRTGAAGTGEAIEHCIDLCEQVMTFLEHLPYPDVVAREMALRIYWGNQRKELAERRRVSPGTDTEVTGGRPR